MSCFMMFFQWRCTILTAFLSLSFLQAIKAQQDQANILLSVFLSQEVLLDGDIAALASCVRQSSKKHFSEGNTIIGDKNGKVLGTPGI